MKEFTILLEIACISETRQGCKCLSSKGWKKPPQDTMLQKITRNAKVSFLIISGVRTRTVYINYQQFRTVKFRSLNSDKTFNISDDIGQRFWIKYLRLFSYFLPVFGKFYLTEDKFSENYTVKSRIQAPEYKPLYPLTQIPFRLYAII